MWWFLSLVSFPYSSEKTTLEKNVVKGCSYGDSSGLHWGWGAGGDERYGMFSLRQVSSIWQKCNKTCEWRVCVRACVCSFSFPQLCKGLSKAGVVFTQEQEVELSSWFNYFSTASPGRLCFLCTNFCWMPLDQTTVFVTVPYMWFPGG